MGYTFLLRGSCLLETVQPSMQRFEALVFIYHVRSHTAFEVQRPHVLCDGGPLPGVVSLRYTWGFGLNLGHQSRSPRLIHSPQYFKRPRNIDIQGSGGCFER